ncbi:MAG: hypothetical protein IJ723_06580, partial [Ruminococcus sp.]|nr:hypothetical protein [Ruminococcus sp.]
ILVMSIVILFVFAAVAGLIPVGAALVLIMGVIIQVAGAAEGSLLIILLLFVSVLESLFQYFCTRIEYADKEL